MKKKKQFHSYFASLNNDIIRGHPTYVYGVSKLDSSQKKFIGLTRATKTQNICNIPLSKSPNPSFPKGKVQYIRPFYSESSGKFGKKKKGWKFSKDDWPKVNASKKHFKPLYKNKK
jgi:hypothetical protein